jgi:HD-GYP domain-containing protein (c-di-GMP phosphodiesterase class II)
VEELNKHAGTQFDPLVVGAAVRMLSEMAEFEYHPSEARCRQALSMIKLRPV